MAGRHFVTLRQIVLACDPSHILACNQCQRRFHLPGVHRDTPREQNNRAQELNGRHIILSINRMVPLAVNLNIPIYLKICGYLPPSCIFTLPGDGAMG